jgi:poly-gamma-glutamate capsule biosynthesis protein CapA/YwtB (metallophosphatase superfamily)
LIATRNPKGVRLFLAGDVMPGRGIDQILPHSVDPALHEPYVVNARTYVSLAERKNGRIPAPVDYSYIWGDALDILKRLQPTFGLINLETSITQSEDFWRDKGIHYRMHPDNIHCLTVAGIDCCALANNHVLDWGYRGLSDTQATLAEAGIKATGAGKNRDEAMAPVILQGDGAQGRVIVLSMGTESSGIPGSWTAEEDRAGVYRVPNLSPKTVDVIGQSVARHKRAGDIVIVSIHWGGNWGYDVPGEQIDFAHWLIDRAGIDLIHGHSSHHPLGIEVYHNKLVIYGCGDLINDYEGIGGYDSFRSDLTLMYFSDIDQESGQLQALRAVPMCLRKFRLNSPSSRDLAWMKSMLDRECRRFHTRIKANDEGILVLDWPR